MKEPRILLNHFPKSPKLVLDKETGILTPTHGEALPIRGACAPVEKMDVCLYAEDNRLFLQLAARRWEIASNTKVNYFHDFDRKVTTFCIADFQVEYEAWWSLDPGYNKFAPELDESYDFLAYVYQLWLEEERRRQLIERWAANA